VQLLLAVYGVAVILDTTEAVETPLHMACNQGHAEIVQLLLAADGVDLNQARTDVGATPLYIACDHGHTEIVQLLLAVEGVDVNHARTADGGTPLYAACDEGHAAVVQLLLAVDGVDVNQARTDDGATPLHIAAYNGHLPITQYLVVYGADMTGTDHDGSMPRHDAAEQGHATLVEWLDAVAGWSRLRIAAGCRLHAAITIQLKRGTMDPDALPLAEIRLALAAAATPAPELPWSDAPELCPLTGKLLKSATQGWAPATHWLHHARVRTAVHTLLLVSERVHRRQSFQRRGRSAAILGAASMPPEMWIGIMRFVLRSGWQVSW
jgi:hypothetical protein